VAKRGLTYEDKIKKYKEALRDVSFGHIRAKNKTQHYTKSKGV
jgi:hypothetical protein